jgi:hypothetical protein
MVCTVSAIGDLPVRRFGLFQAEQALFHWRSTSAHSRIFRGLGDEDRFSRHLQQQQIALSRLLGHCCAPEFGDGCHHTVAASEPELLLLCGHG